MNHIHFQRLIRWISDRNESSDYFQSEIDHLPNLCDQPHAYRFQSIYFVFWLHTPVTIFPWNVVLHKYRVFKNWLYFLITMQILFALEWKLGMFSYPIIWPFWKFKSFLKNYYNRHFDFEFDLFNKKPNS